MHEIKYNEEHNDNNNNNPMMNLFRISDHIWAKCDYV